MDRSEADFFKELLDYWVAALPFIAAILIWFYFWRQRVLRKILLERRASTLTTCNNCNNRLRLSFTGEDGQDRPPDYLSYASYPAVHSTGKRLEVILNVDALQHPPTYQEAVLKLKGNFPSSSRRSEKDDKL